MEGNKKRFLVIDDVLNNLITIKALIKEVFPKAEVRTAQSGEIGLKLAKEREPDVILLDILMPHMDGFEVCRKLKADTVLEAVPVLFVTALKSDKSNRMKALNCGGEAFLNKPVDEVELYVQLRSMLKIREKNLIEKAKSEKLHKLVSRRTEEVVELKEKHKNLLDDLPAMVCEYLPDSTLTYVNKAYCHHHQMSEKELIGKKFLELLPESERAGVQRQYLHLKPDHPTNSPINQTVHNGEVKWLEWRNRAVFDVRGRCVQFYSIGIDITERKMAEKNLIFLSYHDHMTGLYNRRFFEEEMKRLDQARNLPLTIVMADVNGLKIVNDSFGHDAGDRLLKNVANAMVDGFRADDIIARIGGDEFAIILSKTDGNDAETIIKRVRENVRSQSDGDILQSVSFGFETKNSSEENIQEIFAQAENFMYRQKVFESASMRSKVVEIIMNSLFEKSKREMSHSRRVGEIAASIASVLNFSEEHMSEIRTAGLIHDIGKIGVEEQILNKDGELDNDEWIEMKKHPEAGRRILSSVQEFHVIADYVLAHHERWDGSGYPNKLKGKDIPIEARIIAVADAYDAMTSERSYRKSIGKDQAIQEIKRNAGSQFDPEIVEAFLEMNRQAEHEARPVSDLGFLFDSQMVKA